MPRANNIIVEGSGTSPPPKRETFPFTVVKIEKSLFASPVSEYNPGGKSAPGMPLMEGDDVASTVKESGRQVAMH